MADEPTDADSGAGIPRWVKVFGAIALAVVVIFLVLKLTGGLGGHGPARHSGGLDTGIPPVGLTVSGQQR